ncbi:DUF2027 domain-containing protein [Marinilabiliaceae bacterium ANBcel2]|nr:DUF2027 domain-containing protein [Marinilabiliaceae bacterium ANBcel2]
MMIEYGDKVKFLNDIGGGVVTKIEGDLVFVEDADGFEMPVPSYELVVEEKRSAGDGVDNSDVKTEEKVGYNEDVSEKVAFHEEIEDSAHDDFNPKVYLAFIKIDQKDGDGLEGYIINDSNYYCNYLISHRKEDGFMYAMHQGVAEPNTKLELSQFTIKELDDKWTVQLLLFKKGKPFPSLDPVNEIVNIKAKRFFKSSSFVASDFFYQPAVVIPVIKSEFEKKLEDLSKNEAESVIREKESDSSFQRRRSLKRKKQKGIEEVDLHIHELIDDSSGLSNGEMIQIQLDKFHEVMESNLNNRGHKIVFIHGVGNGRLKTELRKLLDRRYNKVYYQDASFKEYGYGATMIIIK